MRSRSSLGRHATPPAAAPSNRTRPARSALSIADDAVWPRPQIDASRIALAEVAEQRELLVEGPERAAGGEPGEQLLLADGPDAARDALAARLVAEERGDPAEGVGEVGGLVEDEDHAGAERRAGGARAPRT